MQDEKSRILPRLQVAVPSSLQYMQILDDRFVITVLECRTKPRHTDGWCKNIAQVERYLRLPSGGGSFPPCETVGRLGCRASDGCR